MVLASSYAATPAQPLHVAIIMDGNGRWAKARGLPRIAGHRQGAEAVRATIKACADLGVGYLTIYAFSSENWKRPIDEVDDLMGLLSLYLRRELAALHSQGVKVGFIGDRSRLGPEINRLIREASELTKNNARLTFTVAINYGGRQEIIEAARKLAQNTLDGTLEPEEIDEAEFARHLQTTALPDPDLIIRTSGEQRLSNFLLWQSAYSELIFIPTLWPDFSREHLERAIAEFQGRERRYGGTGN